MKEWIQDMKKIFLFSISDYIEHWIIIVLSGFFVEMIHLIFMKVDNEILSWILMLIYIYSLIGYLNVLLKVVNDQKPYFTDMFFWGRNFKHFFVVWFLTSVFWFSIKFVISYLISSFENNVNEMLFMWSTLFISGILIVILGFALLEMIDKERKIIESIKFAFKASFDYMGEIVPSVLVSGITLVVLFAIWMFLMMTGIGVILLPFISFFIFNWVYLYYVNLYVYIKQKEELKNNF